LGGETCISYKSEVSLLQARCLTLVMYLWGACINSLDHMPMVDFLWSIRDIKDVAQVEIQVVISDK